MARIVKRRTVVAIVLCLLTGCIKSNKSIDLSGSIVTPLLPIFYAVKIDEKGQVGSGDKVLKIELKGDVYFAGDTPIRLVTLDASRHSYMTQTVVPDAGSFYAIIRIDGNLLHWVSFMDNTGLEPALRRAGVTYVVDGKDIVFSDATQLLAGFRSLDRENPDAKGITYRLATPDQKSSLDSLVEAANHPQAPLPAVSSPPPAQARDAAGFLQFDAGGYANTPMLDEFYLNATDGLDVLKVSQYIQAFIERLNQTSGCNYTISGPAYGIVSGRAVGGMLQGMIQGMQQDQGSMTMENAFSKGATGALQMFKPGAAGGYDAGIFYARHGCASAEARQVFQNMESWIFRSR